MYEWDDFDSYYLSREVMKKIYSTLRPAAEALGGHFTLIDDFHCFRCGVPDDRVGMDFRVPSDLALLYANDMGIPLVYLNVRLCDDCIRWVTAQSAHELEMIRRVLCSFCGETEN